MQKIITYCIADYMSHAHISHHVEFAHQDMIHIQKRTRRASIPRPGDPESPALSMLCYGSNGQITKPHTTSRSKTLCTTSRCKGKILFIAQIQRIAMQYFKALKEGQRRVAEAREYLNGLTGGNAMPAMALANQESNTWEPVGGENMYAFVSDSQGFVLTDASGYILALVDNAGISKAIVQGVTPEQAKSLEGKLIADGVSKFEGKVILPA